MLSLSEFALLIAESANHLNLGIDFTSIIAFLIFISAIVMSILLKYHQKVSDKFRQIVPRETIEKPATLSHFIKSMFEEMDLENQNSKLLKSSAFYTATIALGLFLIISLYSYLGLFSLDNPFSKIISYASLSLIIVTALILMWIKINQFFQCLNHLMIVSAPGMDKSRASFILWNMAITLSIFIFSTIAPMFMAGFNLNKLWYLIPVITIIICIIRLKKVIEVVQFVKKRGYSSKPLYRF
jgi:hypothetical protein